MKADTPFARYDYEWINELVWSIITTACAYLIQVLDAADWTDAGTIWRSIGIGLVRAVLGAVLAFLSHRQRHPGGDLSTGGSGVPEP